MGCNTYIAPVVIPPIPGYDVNCGNLDFTPCTVEQELITRYLLEAYSRLPKVLYRVWNRENTDDRWGSPDTKAYLPAIYLNSEFEWDKHTKEHSHGTWIRTSKIEMKFLEAQLKKFQLIPKEGDTVYVIDRWLEVLSVNKSDLLPGTSTKFLKYVLTVDTKQTAE